MSDANERIDVYRAMGPKSVGHWMTAHPKTITPNTYVNQAIQIMHKGKYRHLPVVQDEKLVGIISDRDLQKLRVSDKADKWEVFYSSEEDYKVEHIMITNVITLSPDDDMTKALEILIERKFGALPVTNKNNKLVGIITVIDLMKAFKDSLTQDSSQPSSSVAN